MPLNMGALHAMPRRQLDSILRLKTTAGPSYETIIDDVRQAVIAANSTKAFDGPSRMDAIHHIAETLVPPDISSRISEFSQVGAAWDVDLGRYPGGKMAWERGISEGDAPTAHVACGQALYLAYADAVGLLLDWLDANRA